MSPDARQEHVVHCWEDARLPDDSGSTCLLLDGHEGPHAFTPDDEITLQFVPDAQQEGEPG